MKKPALILSIILLAACNGNRKESMKPGPDESGKQESAAPTDKADEGKPGGYKSGGQYTYSWTSKAGLTSANTTTPGTYTVAVTDASACTSQSPVRSETKRNPEMIIRTGNLRCSVEDYKKSRRLVEQIIKSHNAWIASENEENTTYSITNTMSIRVANAEFDALLNGLSGIARQVNTKNTNTQDVTAEYVDAEARLKTKKEIEAQYLELLKRATKIQDILDVEEKARVLREEIEAKEGELRLMKDKVSYSTIDLVFYQTIESPPEIHPGFFHNTLTAMVSGWNSFLSLIVIVLYGWPEWLLFALIIYFIYRKRKWFVKVKETKE